MISFTFGTFSFSFLSLFISIFSFFLYQSIFLSFHPSFFSTFLSPFLPSFPPLFLFCLYLTIFLFFHLFFLSTCLSFFLPSPPCFSLSFSFSLLKHLLSACAAASGLGAETAVLGVSQPVDDIHREPETNHRGKIYTMEMGVPSWDSCLLNTSQHVPTPVSLRVASWPGCGVAASPMGGTWVMTMTMGRAGLGWAVQGG